MGFCVSTNLWNELWGSKITTAFLALSIICLCFQFYVNGRYVNSVPNLI